MPGSWIRPQVNGGVAPGPPEVAVAELSRGYSDWVTRAAFRLSVYIMLLTIHRRAGVAHTSR